MTKFCFVKHSLTLAIGILTVGMAATATVCHAAERWPDEQSQGVFVVHANFTLKKTDAILAALTQLQEDIDQQLHVGPPREIIHLFLFDRASTYKNYLKIHFPTAPDRRALFIKQEGPGLVYAYRSSAFDVDLRHEATHALLHSTLPLVPLWLDEGLAEYFEVPATERLYDNPHLKAIQWNLRLGRMPRIERLEKIHDLDDMGRREYRESWAWVHFMLHGPPEAREELVGYLNDIRRLTPPGKLSKRLNKRLGDADARFREHFRNWGSPKSNNQRSTPREAKNSDRRRVQS